MTEQRTMRRLSPFATVAAATEAKRSALLRSQRAQGVQRAQGFTLVELLVALGLLALISTIGVAMLRGSIDSQARVAAHLDDLSRLDRLHAIMAQDFGQAVGRDTRDVSGAPQSAFSGNAESVSLVRIGRGRSAGSPLPAVERVAYRFAEQSWWRAAVAPIDGIVVGEGDALHRGLAEVRLSYRDAAGDWLSSWDSRERGGQLPHAVRVELRPLSGEPLDMLFLSAPQPWRAVQAQARARARVQGGEQ